MTIVTITRRKDPLDGQRVRVLGRLRRHGGVELLVVLPDGSKRMIPQAWTDAQPAGQCDGAATLGGLGDLLAACVLVSALSGGGEGQAAIEVAARAVAVDLRRLVPAFAVQKRGVDVEGRLDWAMDGKFVLAAAGGKKK